MKINKKIIIIMTIVSILSVGCSSINNDSSKNTDGQKVSEEAIDETNMVEIENHIPYVTDKYGDINNSIIDKRYENVKKEELAYNSPQYEKEKKAESENKSDDKEVISEIHLADSIKNDINYKDILLGFTYASETNPTDRSYDEALELVKKVLPDDIEQVKTVLDEEVNKEYIYYKSEKGNFRVGLCYGYGYDDENGEIVDKNLIVGIDYSKEMI